MRNTLVGICILSAFAAGGEARAQTASRQDIPRVVASARGTVVLLKTFDSRGKVIALGSGFRIAGGRYVTNAHVVAGAARVEIFDDAGALLGVARSADMLSTTVDLAILPSVGPRGPYLSLAGMAPAVGEQVVVIGAPEGLTNTVSDGIVSAVRRIEARQLLQISAPISPGSSGGPVLNTRGEVVGVSVSILREGQNLNFAVPVSDVVALATSRPGQFDFPASTQDVSQSFSSTHGSTRSSVSSRRQTLSIGSTTKGQISAKDSVSGGFYYDYFRLSGAPGGSVSISLGSSDFEPFVAAFRVDSDTLVIVTADAGSSSTSAKVVFTLSTETNYVIGVGATTASRSKMGGYTLRVAPAAPAPGDRWLRAGTSLSADYTFDRTTITNTGHGTYVVWESAVYRRLITSTDGRKADAAKIQYEISCSESRVRILSGVSYLNGSVVWSGNEAGNWEPLIPETVGEAATAAVCSYIKAHGL